MLFTGLVLSVIFWTTLYFIPQEYYKKAISWVVKNQTGAVLNINGDIKLSLFEEKVLSLRDVDFINNPGKQAKIVLNFDEIALYREDLQLRNINLKNTQVTYKDELLETEYKIFDLNSEIIVPTASRPMSITGDLVVRGEKVDYDIIIEDPEAMEEGRTSAVTGTISSTFLKLDYDGVHSKRNKKGKLTAKIASIEKIMLWALGEARVAGDGVITFDYEMNGKEISSLNGTSTIEFHNLIQKYTDEAMDKFIRQLTGKTMKIDNLTGSFNIKDGIVYNKDLFGLGSTSFNGKGVVNLVDKTIDYRITPDIKYSKLNNLPNLTPPITIKGSLMHPEITVAVQDVVKEIIKKPEQLINAISNVAADNADGKQIKKDLQGLRDSLLKDPDMQKKLIDSFLGGFGKKQTAQ
jgi:hypothetical protein